VWQKRQYFSQTPGKNHKKGIFSSKNDLNFALKRLNHPNNHNTLHDFSEDQHLQLLFCIFKFLKRLVSERKVGCFLLVESDP